MMRSRKEIFYKNAIPFCFLALWASTVILIFVSKDNLMAELLYVMASAGILFFGPQRYLIAQSRRDKEALRLFTKVRSGEFAVLLRPFFITNKMVVYVDEGAPFLLEETLIEALSIPVLALGKPGEAYGAGRILSDEDNWRTVVVELLRRASIIICIPSGHVGTQWELDEILRNQYLGKTIFLMPCAPKEAPRHAHPRRRGALGDRYRRDLGPLPVQRWASERDAQFKFKNNLKDDWGCVIAYMDGHGLQIPSYDRMGLMFAIRPAGCFVEKLSVTSSEELGAAIARLCMPIPSSKQFDERDRPNGGSDAAKKNVSGGEAGTAPLATRDNRPTSAPKPWAQTGHITAERNDQMQLYFDQKRLDDRKAESVRRSVRRTLIVTSVFLATLAATVYSLIAGHIEIVAVTGSGILAILAAVLQRLGARASRAASPRDRSAWTRPDGDESGTGKLDEEELRKLDRDIRNNLT